MSMFKKATRKQAKLRLALIGPSGSGKTMSALQLARHLGKRVAVIDSERGSASLYAGEAGEFDVLELEDFAPQRYIDAIKAAEREGYDVIVIDSLSHAWMGKGGALEMVDQAAKRSQSKNSFDAWRSVTPAHNALVDAMLQSKAHIIATVRSKTEYVLEENDRGKKVPRKVGMAPVQRDGLEYEFTLVGEMDQEHNLVISKTRCNVVDGAVINKPGQQLAETLKAWLDSGAANENAAQPGAGHDSAGTGNVGGQAETPKASARADLPANATSDEAAAVDRLRAQRDAALNPERDAAVAMAARHGFVEPFDYVSALKECSRDIEFAEVARVLLAQVGPVSGKPEWVAFAGACTKAGVKPRAAVDMAQAVQRS